MCGVRSTLFERRGLCVGVLLGAILTAGSVGYAQEWQFGDDMPFSRAGIGAAKDNVGRIYIPGGLEREATGGNVLRSDVARFNELAPDGDQWEMIADLSGPRAYYGIAAYFQGRVYVIGGYEAIPMIEPLATVERYDPLTGTWTHTSVASLPFPRAEFGVVTDSEGRIYAVGGRDSTMNGSASVDVYDPATDVWSHHSDMNLARYGCKIAIDTMDRIYAVAGVVDGSISDTVERYDPQTGGWSLVAPLGTGREVGTVVADCNGFVYAIGGWRPGYSCEVERFDPTTGEWDNLSPINVCRNNMGGVLADSGRLYAFGGDTDYSHQATVEFLSLPECEIPVEDCNSNSLPDDWDISQGASFDCNTNGVPDECDADTDGDGLIDDCDNCPTVSNPGQENFDANHPAGDGLGDACDNDVDADGVIDDSGDCCPFTIAGVDVDVCGCPPYVPGDIDRDGDVDLLDYSYLQACLSGAGVRPSNLECTPVASYCCDCVEQY